MSHTSFGWLPGFHRHCGHSFASDATVRVSRIAILYWDSIYWRWWRRPWSNACIWRCSEMSGTVLVKYHHHHHGPTSSLYHSLVRDLRFSYRYLKDSGFWDVMLQRWISGSLKMKPLDPSKHREPLTQPHRVAYLKTWLLSFSKTPRPAVGSA